jgi:hypothetical protein
MDTGRITIPVKVLWYWLTQSAVIMLDLGVLNADVHHVSDYHYSETHFSFFFDINGGCL